LYSSPHVRGARRRSLKTIRDLVGKTGRVRRKGLRLPILSRYVLDGLGLKQDRIQSIYLDRAGDGPAMVLDGRAARYGCGHRLARIRGYGESPGREIHRAGCR